VVWGREWREFGTELYSKSVTACCCWTVSPGKILAPPLVADCSDFWLGSPPRWAPWCALSRSRACVSRCTVHARVYITDWCASFVRLRRRQRHIQLLTVVGCMRYIGATTFSKDGRVPPVPSVSVFSPPAFKCSPPPPISRLPQIHDTVPGNFLGKRYAILCNLSTLTLSLWRSSSSQKLSDNKQINLYFRQISSLTLHSVAPARSWFLINLFKCTNYLAHSANLPTGLYILLALLLFLLSLLSFGFELTDHISQCSDYANNRTQ